MAWKILIQFKLSANVLLDRQCKIGTYRNVKSQIQDARAPSITKYFFPKYQYNCINRGLTVFLIFDEYLLLDLESFFDKKYVEISPNIVFLFMTTPSLMATYKNKT